VYPGANVAAYIQQRIDIGQWLVNDLPYTPGLPEREYSVTLSHTNGVGNVWIGNVLHNSNVISLTGNANVINLQLGNSFWEETANAAYTTEGAVAATATFVFDLTRTAPDVKVLANAVTTNVTVSVPGATMTKNNDAWSGQNGFFGYVDNSLSYAAPSNTFAYPTGNIAIIWPNDLANNNNFVNFTTVTSWNGRWTDTATSVAPPSTSNVAWDAYQDTWNLSRYDYTSLYNVSSAVAAANANINLTGGVPNMEAKDWFMANDPDLSHCRWRGLV
jgi:hypothetical protein